MSNTGKVIGSGVAGGLSGAATGAAIGSFIPGIGTAIGAGIGGVAGLLMGGGSAAEASTIDPKKSYKELSWYDKAAATISAKTEGLERGAAGIFGLEDYVGTEKQDLLARLKHKNEDDAGTSYQVGSQITGGGEQQDNQAGVSGQMPSEGYSLGRRIAMEDDPALQNFNNDQEYSF